MQINISDEQYFALREMCRARDEFRKETGQKPYWDVEKLVEQAIDRHLEYLSRNSMYGNELSKVRWQKKQEEKEYRRELLR